MLALVSALAGPRGQLGRPVGGSFLPPPRFPLAQFVLWAAGQHHAPEPQSHEGYQDFRRRLRDRRRGPADASLRLVADFFIGRAALTWVPIGTIVVWLLAGPTDLVGVLPWVLGALVAVLGIGGQGFASIRGWFFYGWFRRQPVLRREPLGRGSPGTRCGWPTPRPRRSNGWRSTRCARTCGRRTRNGAFRGRAGGAGSTACCDYRSATPTG